MPAVDEPLQVERAQRAQHRGHMAVGQAAPDLEGLGRGQEVLALQPRRTSSMSSAGRWLRLPSVSVLTLPSSR